jgi:RNA polymerase sigma-70 factor (ECF subfamily)
VDRLTGCGEEPSDGARVAAVLAGDVDQFEPLVQRYQVALYRLARSRLGRGDWAEDAVQETLLCAFKSLHTYDSRFSFRTWLWTILLNQCRRQLKKQARWRFLRGGSDSSTCDPHVAPDEVLCSDETPFDQLASKERSQLLDRLLMQLPEPQADALRLRFFGGLKFHEVAGTMGCSLSTAKNRVRLGLIALSASLGTVQK